jgi:hypothetical protein
MYPSIKVNRISKLTSLVIMAVVYRGQFIPVESPVQHKCTEYEKVEVQRNAVHTGCMFPQKVGSQQEYTGTHPR